MKIGGKRAAAASLFRGLEIGSENKVPKLGADPVAVIIILVVVDHMVCLDLHPQAIFKGEMVNGVVRHVIK